MLEMEVLDKEFKEKMEIATVTFKHLNPKNSLGLSHIHSGNKYWLDRDGTGVGSCIDPGKSIKSSS